MFCSSLDLTRCLAKFSWISLLASWKPLKLSWAAVGGPPLPLPLPRVPRIFARLSGTWQSEELLTKSDKQLCRLQGRSYSQTCCHPGEILLPKSCWLDSC